MQPAHVDILNSSLGRYRKVRITRPVQGARHLHGFVLGMSEQLVLIFQFHDFHPDGCCVVRREDIEHVRSDEFERTFQRIFRAEGLLDAVGIRADPPLENMRALLTYLWETKTPAIVEAEAFDGEDEDDAAFLIGYVVEVDEEDAWVRHFDAHGQWEEEDDPVGLDEVTCVQIEAPYLETFLRHIPPCPVD
jgi:hypothetical protein